MALPHVTQQIAFQEYLHEVSESGRGHRPPEQSLRGVQLIENQDFHRFANPRQLMVYLGLVPSEDSSGQRRRQGAITKAGNSAARRMPAGPTAICTSSRAPGSVTASRTTSGPMTILRRTIGVRTSARHLATA